MGLVVLDTQLGCQGLPGDGGGEAQRGAQLPTLAQEVSQPFLRMEQLNPLTEVRGKCVAHTGSQQVRFLRLKMALGHSGHTPHGASAPSQAADSWGSLAGGT